MDGPADDQGVVVARQRRRLEALLAELSDGDWRSASRCDGWSVQDVVAHLVSVNGFWAASVSAGLAGTPTRMLAGFDPAAHPPIVIEPMRAQAPRAVFEQFVSSNDGFLGALAALDERGWATTAETPAGHVSIRLLAGHALWDAWVHERDITVPLGLASPDEPDEVESCLRYAAAVGPALTISEGNATSGPLAVVATDPDVCFTIDVGESVVVRRDPPPADAPCLRGRAVDLIDALSVRAPLPDDAPAEWHRLVHRLATVFDTE